MSGRQLFWLIMVTAGISVIVGYVIDGIDGAVRTGVVNLATNYAAVRFGLYRWRP